MMNILLSIAAVFVARYAVENSFKLSQNIIKTTPVQTLEPELLITKKENVKSEILIEEISYKEIDFTPIDKKLFVVESNKDERVEFAEVKKEIRFNQKENVVRNFDIEVKTPKKVHLDKIELELSYREIDEQKAIQVKKLKQIAWSSIELRFPKASEVKIAKSKILKDRISTVIAATEKSTKNIKKIEPKRIQPQNDELLFFDYPKDKQIKENTITKNEKLSSGEILASNKSDNVDLLSIQKELMDTIIVDENSDKKVEKARVSKRTISIVDLKKEKRLSFDPLAVQSELLETISKKKEENEEQLVVATNSIKDVSNKSEKLDQLVQSVSEKKAAPRVEKRNKNGKRQGEAQEEREVASAFIDSEATQENDYTCLNENLMIPEISESTYNLELFEIDYSKREFEAVRNFEVRFFDNINESIEDYGSGKISFSKRLSGSVSTRRVGIYSRGYYPLITDIVLENAIVNAKMPLFSLSSMNEILEKENLVGDGAHLLVELDANTEDAEIDITKKYEQKIYLDKDLRVVDRENSDYNYVLFIGVDAGNAIVKYKKIDSEIITKLIYIEEGAVYYDPNFYFESKSEIVSFYKEGLLSKCKSLININSNDIDLWSDKEYFTKKESTNSLNIKNATYLLGSRKYMSVKYAGLREQLFVGRWGQEKLVLPTEQYINHILSKFQAPFSQNSCVVQLNFSKKIREIYFNGQSAGQAMDMEINVLDRDGNFYKDFSEDSQRAFLLGQEEGAIHIKIKYADETEQYLHSYCNGSKYIVEQL